MRESESRILSGVHWNGTQKEQKALFYLGASAETRIRNRNLGPGIGSGTGSKVVELPEAFIGNQTWNRESIPIASSIGSKWYFFGTSSESEKSRKQVWTHGGGTGPPHLQRYTLDPFRSLLEPYNGNIVRE